MTVLVAAKGPNAGQRFPLDGDGALIGRQPDVAVYLDSLSVSRHHARIVTASRTAVSSKTSAAATALTSTAFASPAAPRSPNRTNCASARIPSTCTPTCLPRRRARSHHPRPAWTPPRPTRRLFSHNAAYKLQVVLAIASELGRALELDPVLGRLLDHLLHLFPQADRGMALLCEGDRLVVRAQRTRRDGRARPISRIAGPSCGGRWKTASAC